MSGSDKCLICTRRMEVRYRGMYDDRYGMRGLFDLKRCSSCGLLQTTPPLSETDVSAVYAAYYPRENVDLGTLPCSLQDPTTLIGWFKIWIAGTGNQGHYYALRGMRVLDFGCGACTSLLELRRMGVDGYGIEKDPNVKRIADHFGLKVHIGSLADDPFPDTKFDLITLAQVLEHVPRPAELLRELQGRLREGGVVILSFPNANSIYRLLFGRRWINWHVPYHIWHFSRRSFAHLCEREGWSVLRWRTVTPNVWTLVQLRRLCSSPQMGIPSSLWCGRDTDVSRKSEGIQSDGNRLGSGLLRSAKKITKNTGLAAIMMLNRVIDALGIGDSLIVFIKPAQDEIWVK